MKRKRLAALLMSVVMSATVLAGCGSKSNDSSNTSGESGTKDSITVSMDGNVTTLCPMESNTVNN